MPYDLINESWLVSIVRAVTKLLKLGFVAWPIHENIKVRREGEVFCRGAQAFYRKRRTACQAPQSTNCENNLVRTTPPELVSKFIANIRWNGFAKVSCDVPPLAWQFEKRGTTSDGTTTEANFKLSLQALRNILSCLFRAHPVMSFRILRLSQ